MPKDYTGKRVNKILTPEDAGFNDPRIPWGGIRNVFGLQKPEAFQLKIAGFYLIDRRMNPSIAIFKNVSIVGNNKPKNVDEPIPFASLDEALAHKNKMNLDSTDKMKISVVALSPDPGIGNARPNMIWVDKKTSKQM